MNYPVAPELDRIYHGDALAVLQSWPDAFVQTCVTSPPYYGLRDYGTGRWEGGDPDHKHDTVGARGGRGGSGAPGKQTEDAMVSEVAKSECSCGARRIDHQLGIETTPQEYVEKMVAVFREVRRVLRDDGTLFLNLGDSYAGALRPGGQPCGISGTKRAGWIDRGYPSFRLCGACGEALGFRNLGNDGGPVGQPPRAPIASIRGRISTKRGLLPTSDSENPVDQRAAAIPDSERIDDRDDAQPLSSPESMRRGSSRPRPAKIRRSGNPSSVPSSHGSSASGARAYGNILDGQGEPSARMAGNAEPSGGRWSRTLDIGAYCSRCEPFGDYTTMYRLKPKDLIGIPWAVAFALRTDGWYLRSDIIWAKKNCMPESVEDRPTRAHEYLFLLAKSARYYYDHAAIREPASEVTIARLEQNTFAAQTGGPKDPKDGNRSHRKVLENLKKRLDKQRGHSRHHAGFNDRWDGMTKAEQMALGRNKRTVWTVATSSFKKAHFATFPPKLIEPCVLAGCPIGGLVLDPFMGSGTTALVSARLNRRFLGIELNPEYVKMAEDRICNEVAQEKFL